MVANHEELRQAKIRAPGGGQGADSGAFSSTLELNPTEQSASGQKIRTTHVDPVEFDVDPRHLFPSVAAVTCARAAHTVIQSCSLRPVWSTRSRANSPWVAHSPPHMASMLYQHECMRPCYPRHGSTPMQKCKARKTGSQDRGVFWPVAKAQLMELAPH